MADDIEQKLKFIIESVGVKQTKKDLDEVNKSTSFLKKHMLGVGVAILAVCAGIAFYNKCIAKPDNSNLSHALENSVSYT